MDFSLDYSPKQEAFAKEVRAWLKRNFPADLKIGPDPALLPPEQYQKLRELGRRLGKMGWLAPTFPKEYGGGGLPLELVIVIELELHKFGGVPLPPYYDPGLSLAAPSISVWGNEEQKKRLLAPILRGEVTTWQLFTEPEAGSDLAGVKTKAVKKGDKYVVDGQKIFVGSMYRGDWLWCLTCTIPGGPRHKNLSMFVIPTNSPGVTVLPLDLIGAGEAGSSRSPGQKNSVFLDNVEVPAANLIGGENNGWAVANSTLEIEHGGAGSITRNHVIEQFVEVCKTEPAIKARLKASPELLNEVMDMYISGEVERLLAMRNYWMRHTNQPRSYEGNQFSLWRKMQGIKFTEAATKVLGPYTLTKDKKLAPKEGLFEAMQRSGIIVAPGGSMEIQRLRMARRIGIGRTAKEAAAPAD